MKRILILDDDIDILFLVKTKLDMSGYVTETIAHWELLNERIENFNPALLLLDISLSGANGLDLCKALKQDKKTETLPVVLFSANVEMAKKVHECGASAYIPKPFAMKDLLTVIEENVKG